MRLAPRITLITLLLAPGLARAQNPLEAVQVLRSCRSASVLAELTGPILSARTAANLGLGDPAFLQPYWAELEAAGLATHTGAGALTSYTAMDTEALRDDILKLHDQIGNAETQDYDVVVGHGASQVLQAAMWAQYQLHGTHKFFVQAPYWFQFPSLIRTGGFEVAAAPAADATQIVTSPNNPMGEPEEASPESGSVIHDLSYHWPQYGSSGKAAHDIMIFSLSKGTGHAGSRVGWALVKDPDMVEKMREYIQLTTGGVSSDAIARARTIIGSQLGRPFEDTVFAYGADVLASRWQRITESEHGLDIANHQGTFVWARAPWLPEGTTPAQALEDAGVIGVDGASCGGSADYVRLNIGCSAIEFRTLLERLPALRPKP